MLDRFGILGSPVRDLFYARRALTIGRPPEQVGAFLSDQRNSASLFISGEAVQVASGTPGSTVEWTMGSRGRATAHLRPGPQDSTEVLMEVRLETAADGGRPRYADNAGVIAVRALHRAKSLIETGEAPSLAVNPAARTSPDPYGD